MILGIALRFLPQFMTELGIIYRAQKSRGAHFSANPFRGGIQSLTALLIPLFTSAFRHAETLSAAMEARCYHGGVGTTRLDPLRLTWRDARRHRCPRPHDRRRHCHQLCSLVIKS